MKISYSINQALRAAFEYELLNVLQMQGQRNDQIIDYFQKRIKELEEHAANQQR